MFQQKCPECWNWFINFFDPSLANTSLESLFKYMIILLVAVIILYGVFSVISYASSAAANFARKVTAPVASLVLVIFMLIIVSQLRTGKTCRFEEEKYLTQCVPKTEPRAVEEIDPKNKKSASKHSWENSAETSLKSASKNSWENSPKASSPPQNSWDKTLSSQPKSTTKSSQSEKSAATDAEDDNCATKKGAKKQECMDKERDYSEN